MIDVRTLTDRLAAGRAVQTDIRIRAGLLVRLPGQPIANGGAAVTLDDVTEMRQTEERIAFMVRHDA